MNGGEPDMLLGEIHHFIRRSLTFTENTLTQNLCRCQQSYQHLPLPTGNVRQLLPFSNGAGYEIYPLLRETSKFRAQKSEQPTRHAPKVPVNKGAKILTSGCAWGSRLPFLRYKS